MKQTIIFSLILFTRLFGQDYFPLEVGNSWTYLMNSYIPQTMTYYISDSLNISGTKYFIHKLETSPEFNICDTIRKSPDGNIWKKINGTDYLWFDFTKDIGTIYTFPSHHNDSSSIYNVEVVDKNFTLKTNGRSYLQCIKIFFDIPQSRDDERYYSFAPNIGIIYMTGGDGPDEILRSALINGVFSGIDNDQLLSSNIYELVQNYPNPFNPVTTIKYNIPKQSNVTLKVYDVLGREVVTLVNEIKNPGNYAVEFNADNLSSGVYIYTLQTNNNIISNKMLLMK